MQVREEPLTTPLSIKASVIQPIFASNLVEVEKEEEAFPFISLVADCGGILGLFIGFNFLMIWDLVVKIWESLSNKKNIFSLK